MEKVLAEYSQFKGKYIALKSEKESTVVGSGAKPEDAIEEAKKNGVLSPYIVFIPDKEIVPVYSCWYCRALPDISSSLYRK